MYASAGCGHECDHAGFKTQQADIGRRIGTDLSVAWTWRPFFTQNIVLRVSGAALLPGGGFKDLYGDRHSSYYSLLGNLIVTY